MTYGYIRVSSDKQTVENQRFEIERYCKQKNLKVNQWVEETVSGTRDYSNRQLGKLLKKIRKEDIIICSELSRLGRNLFMIIEILSLCIKKKCRLYSIKDNFYLEDNLMTKVLAFAFGLSAEIERDLISMRTREALARKKAEGVRLGRPKGSKTRAELHPLYGKEELVQTLLEQGKTKVFICRQCKCSRSTLNRYLAKKQGNVDKDNT